MGRLLKTFINSYTLIMKYSIQVYDENDNTYIVVCQNGFDQVGSFLTLDQANMICDEMNAEMTEENKKQNLNEKEFCKNGIIQLLENNINNEEFTRSYLVRVKNFIDNLILNDF